MNHEFEIEPGIVISKLDLKDGDIILVTIDMDIWDIDDVSEMCKILSKIFPNNNILCTFKGIDIKGVKNEKLS